MLNVAMTHPLFLISRYDNGIEEKFGGLLDLKKPQLIKNGSYLGNTDLYFRFIVPLHFLT